MTRYLAETRVDDATAPIVLLGAGGHARVVLDMLKACGGRIAAVADPSDRLDPAFEDILHMTDDADLSVRFAPEDCLLLNGVGVTPGSGPSRRQLLFERFIDAGYRFLTLIHPAAIVSPSAKIDDGAQVMAGGVVQCAARIGRNTIINTHASVDHDCGIGDHVHIAPGAVLCGGVRVGAGAFVGAGAVLLPGIEIAAGELVPAGQTHRAARWC